MRTVIIKNGRVLDPSCRAFVSADLLIKDGKVAAIGEYFEADGIVDAGGEYVLPGLVDIHTHGSNGGNYSVPADFRPALRWVAGQGVTTVLPTIGVRPLPELLAVIENVVSESKRSDVMASVGGIHLEGPFISEKKKGAMAHPALECSTDSFKKMLEVGDGLVKIMTIAPELEGALNIIAEGTRRGVRMSLGHTMATYAEAIDGIGAGASGATHVFNAMRAYDHRETGVLGAVLTDSRVTCETICDLVHLAPETVKLVRAAKGLDGMILISDSGMITGMGNGEFMVDGKIRYVVNGVSRNAQGTIAGSCYSMADGARKLTTLGFTLPEIALIGALNPARAVGLDSDSGSIDIGKRADIIICDSSFNVSRVFVGGSAVPVTERIYTVGAEEENDNV